MAESETKKPIGRHLMELAKAEGGDHMHIEGHEDGFTTHQVKDGGRVKGPHDHKNLKELKKAMSQFFDEEGEED